MSELVWNPVPSRPTAITAVWADAPGAYTLLWGDGTSTTRRPDQGPVVHVYPSTGTWTVVATSPAGADTAAAQVTTREWTIPPGVSAALGGDGQTVTLVVPEVSPAQWHVDWGDGTATVHTADDVPTHVYEWDFGAPDLRVTDLPSKRTVRFTGPPIGPEPEPEPSMYAGFHFEYLKRVSGRKRRFFVHGGGLKPDTLVTAARASGFQKHEFIANRDGEVHEYLDLDADTDDAAGSRWEQWYTYAFTYTDRSGNQRREYVPLHDPIAERDERALPYIPDADDHQMVEFVPFPAQLGEHHIQFGDGSSETHTATTLPLRVRHRYGGSSNTSYRAKCTFPDGTKAEMLVRTARPAPCPARPIGRDSIQLLWAEGTWCGSATGELYPPLCVRLNNGPPMYFHRPLDGNADKIGYGFYGLPGGKHTLTISSALTAPWQETIELAGNPTRHRSDDVFVDVVVPEGWQPEPDHHTAPAGTWQWERHVLDVTSDDYYTYCWDITNGGAEPYTPAVEFTLADPARVAEADSWRGDPVLTELGSGRWRLTQTAPVPPGEDTRLQIRVQPCGDPRVWPDKTVVT